MYNKKKSVRVVFPFRFRIKRFPFFLRLILHVFILYSSLQTHFPKRGSILIQVTFHIGSIYMLYVGQCQHRKWWTIAILRGPNCVGLTTLMPSEVQYITCYWGSGNYVAIKLQ